MAATGSYSCHDFSQFEGQVRDAIRFLKRRRAEVKVKQFVLDAWAATSVPAGAHLLVRD